MKFELLLATASLLFISCAHKAPAPSAEKPAQKISGHAQVNSLKMYYEIHGDKGAIPLVLIHGGGSSIDVTYSKVLPFFASERKTIAVDEQAHGRSGDRPGPVSFEQTADDVAALLKSLNIAKADIMGFSNGASTALQIAIRHPEVVNKLVFVSSFTKRSGAQPGFWKMMKTADISMMPHGLKDAYLQINPDPKGLQNMHDKDATRMKNFKDVPDRNVKSVKVPTLIVAGDQDVVQSAHVIEMNKMIKNSRILILPGGHGDFLGEISMGHNESEMPRLTAGIINNFLNEK